MSGHWETVDLQAEWVEKDFRPTVNVGNVIRVIAIYFRDDEPDYGSIWHTGPTDAVIVRSEYMGSGHYPIVQKGIVEVVPFEKIRLL